ncbi:hypothetical protein D3C86_1551890 [compost metagenome]
MQVRFTAAVHPGELQVEPAADLLPVAQAVVRDQVLETVREGTATEESGQETKTTHLITLQNPAPKIPVEAHPEVITKQVRSTQMLR